MNKLSAIMAGIGGFRGLAAGAAIAWGTSQATTIATEAQAAVVAAQEALDAINAERERVQVEFMAEIQEVIAGGGYDLEVTRRALTLGWTQPTGYQPGEPPSDDDDAQRIELGDYDDPTTSALRNIG